MNKHKLIKNKLFAIIFVAVGILAVKLINDGTFFVFALMFGIPLFFSKENWVI